MTSSDMQVNSDEDFWRRVLIERRPPLTWKGICVCAIASAAGIGLGLSKPAGEWELLALGLFITGAIQTVRGLGRKIWLGLGGTDQPFKTYLERRLGD
jgi:hypothetical protein